MLKPINKKVWTATDGTEHESINAAKCYEIIQIAVAHPIKDPATFPAVVAEWIVDHGDEIAAILKTKERKARKSKVGRPPGSRNRKANAAPVVPAQS